MPTAEENQAQIISLLKEQNGAYTRFNSEMQIVHKRIDTTNAGLNDPVNGTHVRMVQAEGKLDANARWHSNIEKIFIAVIITSLMAIGSQFITHIRADEPPIPVETTQ